MTQQSLFATSILTIPPDADISLHSGFLDPATASEIMQTLLSEPWRQDSITMWGKTYAIPRLTAWYGDPQKNYTYSGIAMDPTPWTPTLGKLKSQVETISGSRFNSVLLNFYRDGSDSVSWHSDDEPELGNNPVIASLSLGNNPVIASLSLGDTRRFMLRRKSDHALKHTLELAHGDLLLMRGSTQRHWQHQIPKQKGKGARINLTFRTIL